MTLRYVFVVCVGAPSGVIGAAPALGQVVLVRDGTAQAVVVRADAATDTAMYAVEELVWHVALATGVTLDVLPESEAPADVHTRLYVGDMETARAQGIDLDRLPREAYVMRSVGNDLFLVGREAEDDPLRESNPDVGTLFGVYEFLERYLGVRWLWPGDLGTYVPRSDTIELWSVNELRTPSLAFRSLAIGGIGAMANPDATLAPEDERLGFSTDTARKFHHAV